MSAEVLLTNVMGNMIWMWIHDSTWYNIQANLFHNNQKILCQPFFISIYQQLSKTITVTLISTMFTYTQHCYVHYFIISFEVFTRKKKKNIFSSLQTQSGYALYIYVHTNLDKCYQSPIGFSVKKNQDRNFREIHNYNSKISPLASSPVGILITNECSFNKFMNDHNFLTV